ncbi:aminotransferase class I/II-fold pyridoxal phosphate-dependent enzyme [Kitasatospora sp. NBC_00240]|uniref:aminotransferase class I/II-fold pyridoxal phosphate-dependent enzyme n=1 Tax=Kitasatospora sp. NBC_00240 TaxID=2903567 RepID=UPI002258477C|nr:aminotransferase class I/II-fold pyridoxal phosphate-dependent enzyme [Kitasatospora sp. NBC_00240]MCX5208781.1 aminotransferase class I/II-fold pyridoxal phosphate-dependent enzyme [Kitasatospora sp. NBC_00240]
MVSPETTVAPPPHARWWRAGVVQAVSPPGVIDLGPGYLEPDLLPVDAVLPLYAEALTEFGPAALSYGANAGAEPLRALLAARHGCPAEEVMVTAGTSQALTLLCTVLGRPGRSVLVERTCYDLGRSIMTDHGLRLREVDADHEGVRPQALDRALSHGDDVAFVYLTPTFHNPTGTVAGETRRRELLAVAARHGVPIVEDDAYAELSLDRTAPPPSLAALAGRRGVIRLGSFAKTLGPGLRLGWLEAEPDLIRTLTERGQLVSGGALNHLTSLAVTMLMGDGRYDLRLTWLREQLRLRSEALVAALRAGLGESVTVDRPAGGFFVWLTFDPRRSEASLLAAADRAGVVVAPGSRFGSAPGTHLRLAYSLNPPDRLAEAAARLAAAWRNEDPLR